MNYLTKGQDNTKLFSLKNSSGGALDLSSANITLYIKSSYSASTYLIRLRNSNAGGSDSELEVVTGNSILAKIQKADTEKLSKGYSYGMIVTTIADKEYIELIPFYVNDGHDTDTVTASQSLSSEALLICIDGDEEYGGTTYTEESFILKKNTFGNLGYSYAGGVITLTSDNEFTKDTLIIPSQPSGTVITYVDDSEILITPAENWGVLTLWIITPQ
jgi:hypothetical protein